MIDLVCSNCKTAVLSGPRTALAAVCFVLGALDAPMNCPSCKAVNTLTVQRDTPTPAAAVTVAPARPLRHPPTPARPWPGAPASLVAPDRRRAALERK